MRAHGPVKAKGAAVNCKLCEVRPSAPRTNCPASTKCVSFCLVDRAGRCRTPLGPNRACHMPHVTCHVGGRCIIRCLISVFAPFCYLFCRLFFFNFSATMASGDVDLCLVPESPIVLDGPKGCLPHLMKRVRVTATGLSHPRAVSCSRRLVGRTATVSSPWFCHIQYSIVAIRPARVLAPPRAMTRHVRDVVVTCNSSCYGYYGGH